MNTSSSALGIAEDGTIVGTAAIDSEIRAYRMTLVPAPARQRCWGSAVWRCDAGVEARVRLGLVRRAFRGPLFLCAALKKPPARRAGAGGQRKRRRYGLLANPPGVQAGTFSLLLGDRLAAARREPSAAASWRARSRERSCRSSPNS